MEKRIEQINLFINNKLIDVNEFDPYIHILDSILIHYRFPESAPLVFVNIVSVKNNKYIYTIHDSDNKQLYMILDNIFIKFIEKKFDIIIIKNYEIIKNISDGYVEYYIQYHSNSSKHKMDIPNPIKELFVEYGIVID